MNQSHSDTHRLRYYWEYLKRFGKESSETWRRDFLIAFLLAIIPTFLARGNRTVWEGAVLGAVAALLLFGAFALWHLVHTSFILYHERTHPEFGGIRYTHWRYGALGIAILLAVIGGASYAVLLYDPFRKPPVVLRVPTPSPPIIATSTGTNPPQSDGVHTKSAKPPARTGPSQPAVPNSASQATPQATSPVTQPQQPVTFLDRVVQENRGLTPDDRNRLSTELYECDQFIKQSQAVGYKLNLEFGKLSNDRQNGALSKNVDEHIRILHDLGTSAWDRYHGLQHFQEKWQYFPNQTEYVFGDNPFNAGVGLLVNATEGMANSLTSWSKIANRDQQEILNIEAQQQIDFEQNLRHFFDWANPILQRVKQMRQSLDPNGIVQPLPTNAVAPAVGMFSLKRGEPQFSERFRHQHGVVRLCTRLQAVFAASNVVHLQGNLATIDHSRCMNPDAVASFR
jgi:hypothetical protein